MFYLNILEHITKLAELRYMVNRKALVDIHMGNPKSIFNALFTLDFLLSEITKIFGTTSFRCIPFGQAEPQNKAFSTFLIVS
jgi:hypothetical protein